MLRNPLCWTSPWWSEMVTSIASSRMEWNSWWWSFSINVHSGLYQRCILWDKQLQRYFLEALKSCNLSKHWMEQYIWFNNQSYYCFNDTLKIMKTFQGFPDPETTHDSMEIGQSYMLGQEESKLFDICFDERRIFWILPIWVRCLLDATKIHSLIIV